MYKSERILIPQANIGDTVFFRIGEDDPLSGKVEQVIFSITDEIVKYKLKGFKAKVFENEILQVFKSH